MTCKTCTKYRNIFCWEWSRGLPCREYKRKDKENERCGFDGKNDKRRRSEICK